jgi:ferredoxin-fold anticodon binding domain-containing protein
MLDKISLEAFLGKCIVFSWLHSGQQMFSVGTLEQVNDTSILVDYRGKKQLYSLDFLVSVREGDNND